MVSKRGHILLKPVYGCWIWNDISHSLSYVYRGCSYINSLWSGTVRTQGVSLKSQSVHAYFLLLVMFLQEKTLLLSKNRKSVIC